MITKTKFLEKVRGFCAQISGWFKHGKSAASTPAEAAPQQKAAV